MFVATATRTMHGAKQIVQDEPIKRTPRRDRLAELSRKWHAARQPVSKPIAELPPIPPEKRIPMSAGQQIIIAVCRRHGISYADILSNDRRRHIVKARMEAIWALRRSGG